MPKLSLNIAWSRFLLLLALAGLLTIAAFSSYSHLKSLYYDRVEENLRSQIGTLSQSLSSWGRSKRNYVYSWSRQPELVSHVQVIVSGKNPEIRKLSRFALIDYMGPVTSDPEIKHFYLLDARDQIIASDAPESEDVSHMGMIHPRLLGRTWRGMTLATHPVLLNDGDDASIFVASAVKGTSGEPIALLVLEVDPTVSFYEVFKKSAFSETGEAYAFNREGMMLTPGRHQSLPPPGRMFSGEPDGASETGSPSLRQDHQVGEYTPLAGSIGEQRFAVYVREQFVGHDNKPKIGAVFWDSQFQMGIAIEQSAAEGLRLLNKMQWVFISFLTLVLVISFSFFFALSFWSAQRSRKEEQARQALTRELQSLHKKNTLEIADREARYRAIIDTAWDAIFTVDAQGLVQSCNPATARIFSCEQRYIVGYMLEDWIRLSPDEQRSLPLLDHTTGQTLEAWGVRQDQSCFPVALSVAKTHNSQSDFFTVIVRDISQQKASESSLRSAQQRLEMSQAFAYIGTWEWDVGNDRIFATDMALKLNGLPTGGRQISFGAFFGAICSEDRAELTQELNQALARQQPFSVECRVQVRDDEDWLLIQGTPLLENGAVTRVIGHIQLITESKAAEQALEKARYMLRLVLDTIPTGVYWKGTDLKIAGVNKRYCDDIGLPEEAIIGKVEQDIYRNKAQAHLVERLDRSVVQTGVAVRSQGGRYHMNDGSTRYIEISRLPIQDESANTLGMLGVYSDITERLETQQNLQKHHRQLAFIYSAQLRYFSGDHRDDIFSVLLDEILGLTESECGFVGEVVGEDGQPPQLKTFSIRCSVSSAQEHRSPVFELGPDDGLVGDVLTRRELIISNQPDPGQVQAMADTLAGGVILPEGALVAEKNLHCFMGIPLLKGEQLVGVIAIANRSGGYHQDLVNFLQPMFTTCANLLAAMDNDARMIATQKQLLRAKNQAEKASRAKTEFLSRVSHELRTPMNAIIGFTDLLSDNIQDAESSGFLDEIEKASNHLMALINEVLDLERIEAGRIELQLAPVTLSNLLSDCLMVVAPLAKRSGITLNFSPPEQSVPPLFADAARLRQVLLNLISNGIKYNRPEGQVDIEIHYAEDDITLSVRDTGIGLTPEELEHLFESFNRLHAENSDIEGTGMGLVITRRLIELMGGELTVASEKGRGSCFSVVLPWQRNSEGGSHHLINANAAPHLLVLSHQHSLRDICASLDAKLMNFEVDFTASAIGFLEACLQKEYQLLVIDIPAVDGAPDELLQYLCDAEALEHTPLILVADPADEHRLRQYGFGENEYHKVSLYVKGEAECFALPLVSISE